MGISIPEEKLGEVISDVERLVSHFEDLIDQDQIVKHRINDIKKGVKGKSEKELDDYLRKRGVKID